MSNRQRECREFILDRYLPIVRRTQRKVDVYDFLGMKSEVLLELNSWKYERGNYTFFINQQEAKLEDVLLIIFAMSNRYLVIDWKKFCFGSASVGRDELGIWVVWRGRRKAEDVR